MDLRCFRLRHSDAKPDTGPDATPVFAGAHLSRGADTDASANSDADADANSDSDTVTNPIFAEPNPVHADTNTIANVHTKLCGNPRVRRVVRAGDDRYRQPLSELFHNDSAAIPGETLRAILHTGDARCTG